MREPLELLEPDMLRSLLSYDERDGTLSWRKRGPALFAGSYPDRMAKTWNARFANTKILSKTANGYIYLRAFGKFYLAHRVIWAMQSGEWPAFEIDHVDTDKTNNRLGNLRLASHPENARNRPAQSNNKGGIKGVYWDASRQSWQAHIAANGKRHYLGRFKNVADAVDAYAKASASLHSTFGRNA